MNELKKEEEKHFSLTLLINDLLHLVKNEIFACEFEIIYLNMEEKNHFHSLILFTRRLKIFCDFLSSCGVYTTKLIQFSFFCPYDE